MIEFTDKALNLKKKIVSQFSLKYLRVCLNAFAVDTNPHIISTILIILITNISNF